MMHSCCCICFIVWCGFDFIWFGFENLFKWFGKKCKKRKSLPAAWRLGGLPEPACFSLPSLLGQRAEPVFPAPPRAHVGRPRNHSHVRPPFLASLTNRPHMSVASLFSVSWPSRRRARSQPNQNRFSQDFNPNWGVPTLYKLEPSLPPSFLPGFWVVALP
jgi:hypothetical protein